MADRICIALTTLLFYHTTENDDKIIVVPILIKSREISILRPRTWKDVIFIAFSDSGIKMIPMTLAQERKQQEIVAAAYRDYKRKLSEYALFKVRDRETSEDLVQDTFMKTWSYLIKGGKIKIMKAFLYHVLNNLIVDEYRKHKTASLDAIIEKGYEPGDDQSERLFDFLDGKAILSSIEYLPRKYQRVMRMRYMQGLSPKEISPIIGQSKNTISVQTHRGLKKLRLLYNSHLGNEWATV